MAVSSLAVLVFLLLQLLSGIADAWVPPVPGSDLEQTYEPVHEYRRRLNISYNYRPKYLHPEDCRYLTEEQCQEHDESMKRHAQNHQAIQRKLKEERQQQELNRRRQLELELDQEQQVQSPSQNNLRKTAAQNILDSEEDVDDKEELVYHKEQFQQALGAFTRAYNNPHQPPPTREEELEELHQLLAERNQTYAQAKQRWLNREEPAAVTGVNPRVGTFNVLVLLLRFSEHKNRDLPDKYEYQILWNLRIRKWLMENSYGNYDAWFEVQDWVTTDNTEKHYSFGQAGRVAEFAESYWPILDDLDKDPDWDWERFDVDDNGLLDNLIVLHSGYAAEQGGTDCTNNRGYLNRIWSHAFSDSNGWRNEAGTYGVEGYMISSGLQGVCDTEPPYMGIATHEYMHTFVLIDLYDYTFEGKGVGNFDIMAYPYGFSNDGYIPVHLSAWAKTAVDWLECEELTESGTYTLGPAALTEDCFYIMLVSASDSGFDEYLLVENRQQTLFDVNFWDTGIVIYHIDDAANEQNDRGYPGQRNWPKNNKHYQVAVLPGDGEYGLEKGENNGDAGDLWYEGMELKPNNNGNTYPNTDSYQFGKIQKTGVTIEIRACDGVNCEFEITMPTKQGDSGAVFSAPEANAASVPPPPEAIPQSEAQEQFQVPDAEDQRISGKVPQLPWYQEHLEQQQQQQAPANGGGGETSHSAPDAPDFDEFDEAAEFSSSSVTSIGGSLRRICTTILGTLLTALLLS